MSTIRTREPDPTPEQIRELCLQIQAGWTPEERERRSVRKQQPLEVQVMKSSIKMTGSSIID